MINKFRAYDCLTKKIYDICSMSLIKGEICSVYFLDLTEKNYRSISDVEIMQSTGMVDKHGKEIFEDDIICGKKNSIAGEYKNRNTIVKFNQIHGFRWDKWILNSLEIIGNIYENPELI